MPGYLFRPMGDGETWEISGWPYEPPYDFYDWTSDPDDLEELLDPERRKDAYFSAFDERGALVGFFLFEARGQTVDVGLGMRPDLTGAGLGYLLAGVEFARTNDAAPILECAFSLAAPSPVPVSYVNFSPCGKTWLPGAQRASESMIAHRGGRSRQGGVAP